VDDSLIYAGAFPAMALALVLDGILALGERAFTPEGLARMNSKAE
jgi:ABC-type proline/glycine betaine transport system permease subunit